MSNPSDFKQRAQAFKDEAEIAIKALLKKYDLELCVSAEGFTDDYHEYQSNAFIDVLDQSDDVGNQNITVLSADENGYIISMEDK